MIKENVRLLWSDFKRITRICDICYKEESIKMSSILTSRKRGNKLDLCRNCRMKKYYKENKVNILQKSQETRQRRYSSAEYKYGKGHISKSTGYRIISYKGKIKQEHRHIIENKIGRSLTSKEEVHHIDLDRLNNSLDNLYLFSTKSLHMEQHYSLQKLILSFLGKKIWFNREKKIYTLDECKCENIICDHSECEFSHRIYFKTDPRSHLKYQYCLHRDGPDQWRWRRRHVCKMEQILGRSIYKNECVHHIDGNTINNDYNNLCLMTGVEHNICHKSLELCGMIMMKNKIIDFNREKGFYFIV